MVYKRSSKKMRNPKQVKKTLGSKTKRKGKKSPKVKTKTKTNGSIKLRDASHTFTAMCLGKCKRTTQTISNIKFYKNHNGAVRVAGVCSKCGTKMNTFASGKLFM